MTWGWFVSAGLIYGLIPGLNFLSSLAVAACLTPTDPILAAAVVGGKWANKHVPTHLRHLLAAESGCNDGAAYPFLFIALYLMLDAPDVGVAVRDWFVRLWLYQVILGIVIGAVLGFAFRHLMKFCQRHNLIDRHSYVAQYLSLAMLTIGITVMIGSDDLLAAFSCGTAFAWDGFFNRQTEEAVFSSVIDLLFNIAAFIYVGAWMPFSDFQDAETTLSVWRLIVIAILIFLLRRLPVMIALYKWIPDIKTFREAVFSGHFGPIGIGAVFISTLANETIHKDKHLHGEQIERLADAIQPIVAFMVLCSIVLHGLSIPSFSLGRRVHSVSRTWSRHATPDWTNQARVIERGADIVINRDSDMERGELGGAEGKVQQDSQSRLSISDTRTPSVTVGGNGDDGESIHSEKMNAPTEGQPDATPDEGPTKTEWLEGHRRVVERLQSPGDDVEVEVVDEDNSGHQSLATHIKQSLGLLSGLKQTAGQLEGQAGETVKDKVEEIELRVKDALEAHHSNAGNTAGLSGVVNGGEEEEWSSESDGGNDKDSLSISGLPKKRSKARTARLQRTGSSRRGRQRTSIRRANAPPAMELQEQTPLSGSGSETPTSTTPPDDADTRGRSYPTRAHFSTDLSQPHNAVASGSRPGTAESTWTSSGRRHRHRRPGTGDSSILRPGTGDSSILRPGTGDSSLRNGRVSQIRLLHSSPPTRDVSPSRSVRFLDDRADDMHNMEVRNKVSFDLGRSPPGSGRT
ncbi:hypothetical protein DXG01_013079 [Tephrocybe rancida]|nr:hypothetical protein DXG01_013079 [Tephrocybe rancida]